MCDYKRVFIIAEAGVNHNGELEIATRMIDSASKAGVDAVKFQTFKSENLVSKFAKKADYQKSTTSENESQLELIKKLELSVNDHKLLIDYCSEKSLLFISSPFDLRSIDLLNDFGLEIFKIPSGEINNLPYLRKIGHLNKKIIISTGMANLTEIGVSLKILTESGTAKKNITVLHCNTEYPSPIKDVNLLAMLTIKKTFDISIGYSDHTLGIEVAIASAALGACVIEKHFTLDKNMNGPDHKASLEPDELQQMVQAVRNIEKALGNGKKIPSPSEIKNISVVRKSIVASGAIKKGEVFTSENITVKRPGTGISPMEWDSIIGKIAKKDFKKDELILI